jgi:hypothetical protein
LTWDAEQHLKLTKFCHELSAEINRGQTMLRRERRNLRGLAKGQRIAKNNYCIGVLGCGRGKGNVQFLRRGRLYYRESHA